MSVLARRTWLSSGLKQENACTLTKLGYARSLSGSARRLLASQTPMDQRSPQAATEVTPREATNPFKHEASALDKAMGLFFFTEIARGK
jgi:hypothetical protein